jgi:hemerythrin-like domain-containing protein
MGTINQVEKRKIEMQISDDLKKEHQLILKYIGLMERYIEFSLENSNKPILLDKAEEFIGFIQKFADQFHHAKEEDLLFKYLAAPGVLTHCNPLPQMLVEHDLGRKYVQGMKDSLTNKDLDKLIDNTRDYGKLLKEHIQKEDNILYPMAENGIADPVKNALRNEYNNVEMQIGAQNVWNEYEKKFVELEKYLNHE